MFVTLIRVIFLLELWINNARLDISKNVCVTLRHCPFFNRTLKSANNINILLNYMSRK